MNLAFKIRIADLVMVCVECLQDINWSPQSILDMVAQDSSIRALIDTGALITGMTNLQVAEHLLKDGLRQRK